MSTSSGVSFAADCSVNQPLITLENNNCAVSMALVDTSAVSATRVDVKTSIAAKVIKLHWAALAVFYYYYDHVTSGYVDISAHKVINYWSESALTWDQAVDFFGYYGLEETAQSTAVAYGHMGATVNNPELIAFSVSDLARSWADLECANLGVGLKYRSNSTNGSVLFKSYESGYDYRPRLTYYYGSRVYEIKHFYDMSMSDANIQQISEAMEVANAICTNELAVSIYDEGAPVYKGVYTDICRTGRYQPCVELCSTPHHKDVYYLSEMFSAEVHSSNERAAFWTDRPAGTYCQHTNNDYHTLIDSPINPIFAMTVAGSNVIQILNIYPDDNSCKDLACMGILFLHELAHTLGLDERYESYGHGQDGTQCVMEGYNMNDPIEAASFFETFRYGECDAFCSGCYADLADVLPY